MKLLLKKTYLSLIENSVGATLFKNLYAEVDGQVEDLLKGGDLSCAFFVSFILNHFRLIDSAHATVSGLVKDMEKNGWQVAHEPKAGDVLVWEEQQQKSGPHTHIGFYIGDTMAVSNNPQGGEPFKHHVTFGEKDGTPARVVRAVYTHQFLEKE